MSHLGGITSTVLVGNSEEAIVRERSLSPLGYLYGGGLVLAVGHNDRGEAMLNTGLSWFTVP